MSIEKHTVPNVKNSIQDSHSTFGEIAHITEEVSNGSAGISAAVVLVVLALAGLVAFLFFRKKMPAPAPSGESTFINKLYFNNPIRALVDTKSLVANIEQNEQA